MKQFPPAIKEYIPLKGSGVAYLYEYTNIENMMKYVGIHLGLPEDTYLESSKNPEFRKVMAGSEPVLIFKILQYGTYKQMQETIQTITIRVMVRLPSHTKDWTLTNVLTLTEEEEVESSM